MLETSDGGRISVNIGEGGISAVGGTAVGADLAARSSGSITLTVAGNVTGDTHGMRLTGDTNGTIDVLVEGTISGQESALNVSNAEDGFQNAVRITVWKADVNENGSIVTGEVDCDHQMAETIEKNLLYIIKLESESLSAKDSEGNSLEKSHGYDVAKEEEKVYINVDVPEGYRLTGVYNGPEDDRQDLDWDENGYYVIVPKGGGVSISVSLEKEEEDKGEEETKDKDGKKDKGGMIPVINFPANSDEQSKEGSSETNEPAAPAVPAAPVAAHALDPSSDISGTIRKAKDVFYTEDIISASYNGSSIDIEASADVLRFYLQSGVNTLVFTTSAGTFNIQLQELLQLAGDAKTIRFVTEGSTMNIYADGSEKPIKSLTI